MSTVKATNFQHPSALAAGITLGSDGSVVLPSGFTGGIGTNVVSANITEPFTTTSTSYVDVTGLTVSITPTSTSSKLLITISLMLTVEDNTNAAFLVVTDSSNNSLLEGTNVSSRTPALISNFNSSNAGENQYYSWMTSYTFLHSPNTTSAFTAKTRIKSDDGTTIRVGAVIGDGNSSGVPRVPATITAIEVAA